MQALDPILEILPGGPLGKGVDMTALEGQKPNGCSAGLLGHASCLFAMWTNQMVSLERPMQGRRLQPIFSQELDGQLRQARGPLFEFVLESLTQLQPDVIGVGSGLDPCEQTPGLASA